MPTEVRQNKGGTREEQGRKEGRRKEEKEEERGEVVPGVESVLKEDKNKNAY
jgi:hypothetical protein